MLKLRPTLLATILVAPVSLVYANYAVAQPVSGPYVNLQSGYSIASAIKAKNLYQNGALQAGAGNLIFKNGYDASGAVGYGFNNGWRVELEGNYIHNGASKARYNGMDYTQTGHIDRSGMFVNGIFDFDVGLPWLYPYLGAGLGFQQVGYKLSGSFADVDQTQTSLAYQGMVGVSLPIAPVMGLSATVGYSFVGLTTARKYHGMINGQAGTFKAQGEYNNQFNIGLRYEFAPPAPPPVPVAGAQAP